MILISFIYANGKEEEKHSAPPDLLSVRGGRFILKYQAFASHDKTGTDIDTVSHLGDYIVFALNGKAYLNFNGEKDTVAYTFVGNNSISFGDTPFVIKSIGHDFYTLCQNEEEANGDYNRVTYYLKREF